MQNMKHQQISERRLLRKKKLSYKRHTILIMWALFITYFTFSAGENADVGQEQDVPPPASSLSALLRTSRSIGSLALSFGLGSSNNNTNSSNLDFNSDNYDDILGDLIEGVNCTPAAIADFPRDLFTQEQRSKGAIALHFLGSLYIFYMVALVCDDFFVPSIECICDDLHLSSDVAGATFMAIATSAPELFTNVVGTFITQGDIGLGTIVGSAVFNILAVGACCGLAAKQALQLEWFPLTRDCLFYSLSVIALILVQMNRQVYWYEALGLVSLYCIYIVVMYNNVSIKEATENFVNKLIYGKQAKIRTRTGSKTSLAIHVTAPENESTPLINEKLTKSGNSANYDIFAPTIPSQFPVIDDNNKKGKTVVSSTDIIENSQGYFQEGEADENDDDEYNYQNRKRNMRKADDGRRMSVEEYDELLISQALQKSVAHAKEEEEEGGLFILPRGAGAIEWTEWILGWPARFCLLITMPDCRQERMRKWYPLTFVMCIVWIGGLSYLISWFMTTIGHTFGIPDSVMGLTFLAAGTSVPEAVSSVIVARQGLGGMGISNSIGSNTFDILICLGLPWLIRGSLIANDTINYVHINSGGFGYTIIMLIASLVLFYVSLACNHFVLDKKVGFMALVTYGIFLVISSLMELNVFFPGVNLPSCPTDL